MSTRFWIALVLIPMMVVAGCSKKAEPKASKGSHGVWMTDFEAAKQKAAAEGKDLLMDFSGSDWCGWCIKLDEEVFSKPAFIEEAGKSFVFVLLDFPRDKSGQSSDLQAQNKRLAEQFSIQGYPTVILAKADGTSYAETGYLEGGPEAFLANLKELKAKR